MNQPTKNDCIDLLQSIRFESADMAVSFATLCIGKDFDEIAILTCEFDLELRLANGDYRKARDVFKEAWDENPRLPAN